MKKVLWLLAIALLVTAGSVSAASIVGTKHDLKAALPTSQQVCVFCHTPHQVAGQTTDPLWNHTLSANANYTVYASLTLNAAPTDIGGGTTVSNLCMSCHDGTVGPGSLYNKPNSAAGGVEETPAAPWLPATMITAYANMGIVLSNDHPINFNYDATLATADGGLVAPNATINGWLVGGTLQCSSCHEVHDATFLPFLRATNVGSALCLTCHTK